MYRTKPRARNAILKPPPGPAGPSPYEPGTPGFAERAKVHKSTLPGGLHVETIGAKL